MRFGANTLFSSRVTRAGRSRYLSSIAMIIERVNSSKGFTWRASSAVSDVVSDEVSEVVSDAVSEVVSEAVP